MNEEFDKNKIPQPVEEQEIDLIELAKKVWANRKLVFKTCGIAVIVALVVAFSIPKEYATSVTLAPETTGKSTGGSMGALAAMAGVNLGNSGGDDALFPELYPDIVSSTPFLTELFDVKVEDQKGELKIRLYDYLDEHQRSPWWGAIVSAPFKALGWVVSLFKDEPTGQGDGLSAIRMVSSVYLGLLIFLSEILIPACVSSSPEFLIIYSAYKLNRQGDNMQP